MSTTLLHEFDVDKCLDLGSGAESFPSARAAAEWDSYWEKKSEAVGKTYQIIATIYRNTFIAPNLSHFLRKHFRPGAELLHAGCGSGEVDRRIAQRYRITALDISSRALNRYAGNNPYAVSIDRGNILDLPHADGTFDGVYNLGVMEHFSPAEIRQILGEFRRVLKPGGKIVLFWPMITAPSVFVLGCAHRVLQRLGKREPLHPPEISLLQSKGQAAEYLNSQNLRLLDYSYNVRDLFVQAVVVGGVDALST